MKEAGTYAPDEQGREIHFWQITHSGGPDHPPPGPGGQGWVYLFTGSKSTGGFCVTRRGLLEPSRLGHILAERPALRDCRTEPGAFVPYKGRAYCWLPVSGEGVIALPEAALTFLALRRGMELLAIRSSDIAFTMGARGPLMERAAAYEGALEVY